MIVTRELAELEVQCIKKLDFIIDEMVKTDFTERDIETFTETVRTFLRFFDLRQYVLTALYDKAQQLFNLVRPNDQTSGSSYRKFLSILLQINDEELTDALETFLAKDKDPAYFLVLVEEEVRKGMDFSRALNLFVSLMEVHHYDLDTINAFLKIIGQDHKFFITYMLEHKFHIHIRRYLQQVGEKDKTLLDDIVPIIMARYDGGTDLYLGYVLEVMLVTNDHTHNLLNFGRVPCYTGFLVYLLAWQTKSLKLINNMYYYIREYKAEELDQFESDFLNCADSDSVLSYALEVPTSNKRKVLKRLVDRQEAKDEKNLVEFIKHFPEYRALLPML